MTQYFTLFLRVVKDSIDLSRKLVSTTTNEIEKTLNNWSQIQNKKFWKCTICKVKFDLALTKYQEICIMCRLKRAIEN